MAIRINSNVEVSHTYQNFDLNREGVRSAIAEQRANVPHDKVQLQGQGLLHAQRNAHEALSIVSVGERVLQTVSSLLEKAKSLADAFPGTENQEELQHQAGSLRAQVQRLVSNAHANGVDLFARDGMVSFQVGASREDVIHIPTSKLLGGPEADIDEAVFDLASSREIEEAQANVDARRGYFQTTRLRLEGILAGLEVFQENLAASLANLDNLSSAHEAVLAARSQLAGTAGGVLPHTELSADQVLRLLR